MIQWYLLKMYLLSIFGAGDNSLNNISFDVKKGETIGIIGSTGSGKSTLVNLIPRFYDISNGSILIDGKNIKEYSLKSLRSKISVVMQRTSLFKELSKVICW